MRTRLVALLPIIAVMALGVAVRTAAFAGSAPATDLVGWANAARAAAGRPAYAVRADLDEVAVRHARRMAAERRIWHNPNLTAEVDGWVAVGENVGVGGTARSVHDAFMDSPTHRGNILDHDYTEIGVGAVTGDDGRLYVAEVFRQPVPATTTAAPAAQRPAGTPRVTAPAASRPRTTAAPARQRPAPTVAQVLAAHRAPRTGALSRAVAYNALLDALATTTG